MVVLLTLMAGMMSGLTLGLMSLDAVDLEVRRRAAMEKWVAVNGGHAALCGTPPSPPERRGPGFCVARLLRGLRPRPTTLSCPLHPPSPCTKRNPRRQILKRTGKPAQQASAAAIVPLLRSPHRLLVTLLLCNSFAAEALPLFLDRLADPITAVVVSVTVVLLFGEIIPQALCASYGLEIGAAAAPFVSALLVLTAPVSWPISKVLDSLLGKHHTALFKWVGLSWLGRPGAAHPSGGPAGGACPRGTGASPRNGAPEPPPRFSISRPPTLPATPTPTRPPGARSSRRWWTSTRRARCLAGS